MTVTISDKTARAAMSALQCSIQQKHRRDALDGAPSRRGRFKVTSEDHTAHDEIATALGESTAFAISAHGEPTPDDISKASDLAYLLIRFWAQHSWMGEDKKHLIPPGASSDLADTLTLSVASLLSQNSSVASDEASPAKPPAPVVVTPVRKVSLKMSAIELRHLCQRHQIHNARWRNAAAKTAMVQALFAAGVRTDG